MKAALITPVLAMGFALAGCGGGNSVGQVVDDHYGALSADERTSLCELWNSGTESQDNIVELEMSLSPSWEGGDILSGADEQELGNAIATWYAGNC